MDIARPFKAVFADPAWLKKMAIAAAINFVPILGLAITGYLLEYQKNVAEGRDDELPEWNRLGEYWVTGLQVMAGIFVYTLPVVVLVIFMVAAIVATGVSGSEDAIAPVICGVFLVYGVAILAMMVLAVLSFALMTHYNAHRRFGAFFEFGQVWRTMRANAGMYFGALGMSWLVSIAMSMITTPISYGASFAMVPFVDQMSSEADFFMAMAVMSVIYLFMMVVIIVLYTPAYHVMFHYLGQYMGRAYGYAPVPSAAREPVPLPVFVDSPEDFDLTDRDEDILPPPPSASGPPTSPASPPPQD